MTDKKEMTARYTSVGADDGQSLHALTETSISEDSGQNNPLDEDYQEVCRRMQRMSDPAYLHTVAMNELYENVYQSRPPVIDGLLYSGTYLFRKLVSHSSLRNLPTMSVRGKSSGITKSGRA